MWYISNNGLLKKSRGNQKISRDKWQQKQHHIKPMGCMKAVLGGKFIVIQAYLRKQEKQCNLTSKTTRERRKNI